MFSIAPYHLYGVSCNDKKLASCGMLILLKGEKVDDKVYHWHVSYFSFHVFKCHFQELVRSILYLSTSHPEYRIRGYSRYKFVLSRYSNVLIPNIIHDVSAIVSYATVKLSVFLLGHLCC